jgi:hypothetical protein
MLHVAVHEVCVGQALPDGIRNRITVFPYFELRQAEPDLREIANLLLWIFRRLEAVPLARVQSVARFLTRWRTFQIASPCACLNFHTQDRNAK